MVLEYSSDFASTSSGESAAFTAASEPANNLKIAILSFVVAGQLAEEPMPWCELQTIRNLSAGPPTVSYRWPEKKAIEPPVLRSRRSAACRLLEKGRLRAQAQPALCAFGRL